MKMQYLTEVGRRMGQLKKAIFCHEVGDYQVRVKDSTMKVHDAVQTDCEKTRKSTVITKAAEPS